MNQVIRDILRTSGVDISTERTVDEVAFYSVPGGRAAVELWKRLAPALRALGHWPVVCGDDAEFDRIEEQFELVEGDAAELLEAVPPGPPLDALRAAQEEQRRRSIEYVREHGPAELLRILEQAADENPARDEEPDFPSWPSVDRSSDERIVSAYGHGEQTLTRVTLAVLETADPADAPILLRFGAFNDCPHPPVHVAFLRDWRRRFGAVPIAVTADVIELWLAQPVQTREDAWALASEFYAYCPDIVDQGTETLNALAAETWRSRHWFFWWD